MKLKYLILNIILLSISTGLWAQEQFKLSDETREKFYAQKVAFITNKLALTPAEAQVFWPVYDEYQAKKNLINEDRRKTSMYIIEHQDILTEKELGLLCDKYISFDKQESDLLIEYNKKFKETLPLKKVLKLYQAEYQFKGYLLRQIRNANQTGNRKGLGRND